MGSYTADHTFLAAIVMRDYSPHTSITKMSELDYRVSTDIASDPVSGIRDDLVWAGYGVAGHARLLRRGCGRVGLLGLVRVVPATLAYRELQVCQFLVVVRELLAVHGDLVLTGVCGTG